MIPSSRHTPPGPCAHRWLALACALAPAAALAQAPQYEQTRGISEFAHLAEVIVEQAHFYRDGGGCPRAGDACRRPAFVVKGDLVVVTDAGGNAPFVKGYYVGSVETPATAGWLRTRELRYLKVAPEVPASAWLGRFGATPYRSKADTLAADLEISVDSRGGLRLRGESVPHTDGRPVRGLPVASVDGPLRTTSRGGVEAVYEGSPRGSCDLNLVLLGPYLAVDAKGLECGGEGRASPTFQGLFLRVGVKPTTLAGAANAAAATAEGRRPSPGPAAAGAVQGFTLARDTRMTLGRSYRSGGGALMTPESCLADCAADPKCKAYEYRPGVPNERPPGCTLYSEPGERVKAPGFLTGVRP